MAQWCVFSGEPLISVLRSTLEDKIGQRTPSQVNQEEGPSRTVLSFSSSSPCPQRPRDWECQRSFKWSLNFPKSMYFVRAKYRYTCAWEYKCDGHYILKFYFKEGYFQTLTQRDHLARTQEGSHAVFKAICIFVLFLSGTMFATVIFWRGHSAEIYDEQRESPGQRGTRGLYISGLERWKERRTPGKSLNCQAWKRVIL